MPIVVVIVVGALILLAGDHRVVRFVDDLTTLGLAGYASWCAAVAARSSEGRVRLSWTVMATALAAWAIGDLVWLLCEYVLRVEPFPSPADVFYLQFTVLAAFAVLMMARSSVGSVVQGKLRILLDGVMVALSAFLLAWILALNSVYDAYDDDKVAFALALLYPVADIGALAVAVLVLARAEVRQRRSIMLLVAAFAVTTITDSAFAYLVASGRYVTGSPIDIGWFGALLLFAAAALTRRHSPPPTPIAISVPSNSSLWLPYLPLLLAGTVGPALVMNGLEKLIVPLMMTAVCVRQVAAAWENRQLLSAVAAQALQDPLTGLANRTLFNDRLAHAMMLRSRSGRSVAVVSLDLDDFKLVNDSLGHPVADSLLVDVGRRIADSVRTGDTVARVGGDEFALLLEGEVDDSHLVARRVIEAFNEPFLVDDHHIWMRPSVGVAVALSDEDDVTPETLIKRADIAMYAAKRSRSSRALTFNADMALIDPQALALADGDTDRVRYDGAAKVRLLGELRQAIDHGELAMVYQPKVRLDTGCIDGVEALLRWPHPQLGTLRPDSFMSLVRQHGLMRPVTDLVIERVLADAARWLAEGTRMPVAVNLFAPFLRDPQLPAALGHVLAQRGLAAELLTVEITEDVVLNDLTMVTAVLTQLRTQGIRVAIDDFGSGYSALSYLRDLPIDEVKLDRHFIASVTTDDRAAAVVRAVIDLTHDLGMTVVAEGVEEAATAVWLRDHQCDIGQGYYFGRPIEAAAVPALVGAAAR
ncbi:putative bifunctional diguanylate cyclase/phosphodiesterase [Mycolicibacterium sp.]|uniref:putative bifunctional diguanylate cyclase/phosphodiesterase n=1 Tax=Mycolicibacterium sp. TaxID=2320850 RepID=UPI003D0D5792